MSDEISTPEQLKDFLTINQKMKFTVKLFKILEFTWLHREYATECGAFWCEDKEHFISHALILGKFLGIKANSINTNFRMLGFRIVQSNYEENLENLYGIHDPKNWKKRINNMYRFNGKCSIDDIKLIPCSSQKPEQKKEKHIGNSIEKSYQKEFMGLPRQTRNVLNNDFEEFVKVKCILNKMNGVMEHKLFVLSRITYDWIKIANYNSRVNSSLVLDEICSYVIMEENIFKQLRINILCLIKQIICPYDNPNNDLMNLKNSQSVTDNLEEITFSQFFEFSIRYGLATEAANFVKELSDFQYAFPEFSYSNQINLSPQFHSWFQPFLNNIAATRILEKEPTHSWLIRPSSIPGLFTVHYKRICKNTDTLSEINGELNSMLDPLNSVKILATCIAFNAFHDSSDSAFSVLSENNVILTADKWNTLLFDVMKLKEENSIKISSSKNVSQYVTVDQLANSQNSLNQQIPLSSFSSLSFQSPHESQEYFQISSSQLLYNDN